MYSAQVSCLLAISLLLHAESPQAATVDTGWSSGGQPADVPSARCSDGSLLSPINSETPAAIKHDHLSSSGLSSASGYTCSKLLGYNNGGNWMMNFLGVGQQLAKDGAGTPLQLNCTKVPPSYVAVGYSAVTGGAVDAINFVMAALPAGNGTAAAAAPAAGSPAATATPGLFLPPADAAVSQQQPPPAAAEDTPAPDPDPAVPAQQPTPAAAAAVPPSTAPAALNASSPQVPAAMAAAPTPAPAPAAAAEPSGQLSTGVIVGIVASSLVGLSAVITIAYNVWKWANKHRLVAAKHLPKRQGTLPRNQVQQQGPLPSEERHKNGSLLQVV